MAKGKAAQIIRSYHPVEHIRARPGMYIGNAGLRYTESAGLRYIILRLIDLSAEEGHAGHATLVSVELLADGGCRVSDDGEGIPVYIFEPGVRFLERAMTSFLGAEHGSYALLAPNALSRRLVVEVQRDGFLWRQVYERGQPSTALESVRPVTTTGTTITFWPDPDIFRDDRAFSYPEIRDRLRDLAWLTPEVRFTIRDDRVSPALEETFYSEDGLAGMLAYSSNGEKAVHPTIVHGQASIAKCDIQIALAWFNRGGESRAFTNNYHTSHGGTHLDGLRTGITRAITTIRQNRPVAPTGKAVLKGEDIRDGLFSFVAVNLPEPQFNSAMRVRLNNLEVEGQVAALTRQTLEAFFRDHPDEAEAILAHILARRPRTTGMP